MRVLEETVLSEDWSVLKKTRLSFRRSDGAWQEQWRETYDRGNGATILLYNLDRRTVVVECGIDDALRRIADGDIRDGKTILLLQYAALHLFRPAAP